MAGGGITQPEFHAIGGFVVEEESSASRVPDGGAWTGIGGQLDGLFLAAVCLRVSIPLLAVCGFGAMFCGPITIASSQAIWQAKVAPELQGRVFAFRRAIAMSASIIAPLLAAPLADYVFKPAMASGGTLARVLGPFIGVGAGRGVGVLISVVGLLIIVTTIVALGVPQLRRVEVDLLDYDPALEAAPESQAAAIQ